MRPRSKPTAALVLLLLGGLALLPGCAKRGSVEEQVTAAINSMESAIEEGQVMDAMALVADDFQGQQGRLLRKDLFGLVTLQRNRFRDVSIQRLPLSISSDGGNFATANFQVVVTGGAGLLPERGRLLAVASTWTRESGDWQLWRADWTPVSN
jgi:hypothetical protein